MSETLTHFDTEGKLEFELPFEYKLKTTFFKNNTVDFVMTKIRHRIQKSKVASTGFMTVYPKTLSDTEFEAKKAENLERAIRRARQAVHHHCRQIGADHMLTLTTRENITDRAQFLELFTRFIRNVRTKDAVPFIRDSKRLLRLEVSDEKRNWAYCGVPELQDRGAYHIHVACVGRQDLDLLRSCWYDALGGSPNDSSSESLGQIDVQYRQRRWRGQTEEYKTFGLVSYLTKYISKSFELDKELGQHRYAVSRGIEKPQVQKQYVMACFSNGKGFFEAMQEILSIADFIGVKPDFQLWNRGEDIFMLRGELYA